MDCPILVNNVDEMKGKIQAMVGEVDGRSNSSSDTEVEEPKKRPRSGSLKKDQANASKRGSKQIQVVTKVFSATSGDDPDLESDAKTPKKFLSKKQHKDSDFFASSDSDYKEKEGDINLRPVEEEVRVIC